MSFAKISGCEKLTHAAPSGNKGGEWGGWWCGGRWSSIASGQEVFTAVIYWRQFKNNKQKTVIEGTLKLPSCFTPPPPLSPPSPRPTTTFPYLVNFQTDAAIKVRAECFSRYHGLVSHELSRVLDLEESRMSLLINHRAWKVLLVTLIPVPLHSSISGRQLCSSASWN